MGYTTRFTTRHTRFTTRQRKFKTRHSDVSNSGVTKRSWICATLGTTLSRFSVLMDINDDFKCEILLLTRYLLDHYRRFGFKRATHSFAKEANIDLEQPLNGSLMEYMELWTKGTSNVDYWTFFWYIKLNILKEHTFEGKALTITTPNQEPLSVDQSYTNIVSMHFPPQKGGQDNDHAMHSEVGTSLDKGIILCPKRIHRPRRVIFWMLKKYFNDYFAKCGGKVIGGIFVEESEVDEEQPYDATR